MFNAPLYVLPLCTGKTGLLIADLLPLGTLKTFQICIIEFLIDLFALHVD